MEWISNPQAWLSILPLILLEIVLGVDNVIFISILTGKLPKEQQAKARYTGLLLAMLIRIGLLFCISWIMGLKNHIAFFESLGLSLSGKDLILIVGGLFLLAKSTLEIHNKLEGEEGEISHNLRSSFRNVIIQILLLDIIFSLDSVITAVGTLGEDKVPLMAFAVVISVLFMLLFAGKISHFVERHPTIKVLALSFLILIGVSLIGEGLGLHIPKAYIYFAMAFSLFVEMINLRMKRVKSPPVELRQPFLKEEIQKAQEES